ncbi:MAG: hypothetical protein V4596_13185 [Bdellovibrionota bacterium]
MGVLSQQIFERYQRVRSAPQVRRLFSFYGFSDLFSYGYFSAPLVLSILLLTLPVHSSNFILNPLAAVKKNYVRSYTFKMSEGREVRYYFSDQAQEGFMQTRINGMLLSQSSSEPLLVMVDFHLSEEEIRKLNLPPHVRVIRADPVSTAIPRQTREVDHYRNREAVFTYVDSFLTDSMKQEWKSISSKAYPQFLLASYDTRAPIPHDFIWRYHNMTKAVGALAAIGQKQKPPVDEEYEQYKKSVKKEINFDTESRELRLAFEAIDNNANGKFIIPNEFGNYLHYQGGAKLDRSAVISVGTLRSFNLAAVLKRDLLIAMDYSDEVREFNLILAQLIAKYSLAEFLSVILGGNPNELKIQSKDQFINRIQQLMNREPISFQEDPLIKKFHEFFPKGNVSENQQSLWLMWVFSLRQYTQSDKSWLATFFSNEENYNHIKKMILDKRFLVVRGSLSGDFSMPKIALYLKENKYTVSELDVSNAIEHISQFSGEAGIRAFQRNMLQLPIAKGSRVLITVDKRYVQGGQFAESPQLQKWIYLARSFPELADDLQNVRDPMTLSENLSSRLKVLSCKSIFLE